MGADISAYIVIGALQNVAKLVFECNMTPMYEHSKSFYCDKRSRNLDGL